MKKKLFGVLLTVCMLASVVAGCGKDSQTATYTMTQETNGLTLTDTMKLDAEGDVIQKITETVTIDMTECDETAQEAMIAAYDELAGTYSEVEGVECTGSAKDGIYTLNIKIDATGDAIENLSAQGLMTIQGGSGALSFEETCDALVNSGYEVK